MAVPRSKINQAHLQLTADRIAIVDARLFRPFHLHQKRFFHAINLKRERLRVNEV